MRKPPRAVTLPLVDLHSTKGDWASTKHTGVDGGHSALDDHRWKAVQTSKGGYNLLKGRQLGDHIEEQSNKPRALVSTNSTRYIVQGYYVKKLR